MVSRPVISASADAASYIIVRYPAFRESGYAGPGSEFLVQAGNTIDTKIEVRCGTIF